VNTRVRVGYHDTAVSKNCRSVDSSICLHQLNRISIAVRDEYGATDVTTDQIVARRGKRDAVDCRRMSNRSK
jgi:hypothetical protein